MIIKKLLPVFVTGICIATTSIVCYAEPTENETIAEEPLAVTEELQVEPTEAPTEAPTPAPTEAIFTTPSYYDEILKYVGEENAPGLNENLNNNAITIDQSSIDYSQKSLYTITTRSGDVFYLIINSSDGSVFFLNSVDTSDLTALLSKDQSNANNQINQTALDDMQQVATDGQANENNGDGVSAPTQESKSSSVKSNFLSTIVIIAVVSVIAIVVGLIKNKKSKHTSFDDDFLDSFDNEPDSEIIPYSDDEPTQDEDEHHHTYSVKLDDDEDELPKTSTENISAPVEYFDDDDFEEAEE